MKIAIGCDHAGPELKAEILAHLDEKGVEYTDFGIQAGEKVDYPDKAKEVCEKVALANTKWEYSYAELVLECQ